MPSDHQQHRPIRPLYRRSKLSVTNIVLFTG
jgi:hypothetical protein